MNSLNDWRKNPNNPEMREEENPNLPHHLAMD